MARISPGAQRSREMARAAVGSFPLHKPSVHQLMSAAVQHHQAGRLANAESIYRQVLGRSPHNPEALHLLGLLLHQSGHHVEAVRFIDRAISFKRNEATFYVNGAMAYSALGDLEQAA